MVAAKLRSGRLRKLSERTACKIARKANKNPSKDFQEDLADSGVVMHYSIVQLHLYKNYLHGSHHRKTIPLSSPQHSAPDICKGTSKQA